LIAPYARQHGYGNFIPAHIFNFNNDFIFVTLAVSVPEAILRCLSMFEA